MQVQETSKPVTVKASSVQAEEHFKPKGAFAFFILLIMLGLIIWYSIYFLMLHRS